MIQHMPSSARDDTVILLPEKLFYNIGTPVGIDEIDVVREWKGFRELEEELMKIENYLMG